MKSITDRELEMLTKKSFSFLVVSGDLKAPVNINLKSAQRLERLGLLRQTGARGIQRSYAITKLGKQRLMKARQVVAGMK